MNKNTALLIGAMRDEADIIRAFWEGDTFDDSPIETPIGNLDPAIRVRSLQHLHIPITKHLGKLTDDERHSLFTIAFGRPIKSADEITNFEAEAWRRLLSRFNHGNFIKRALEDMKNERYAV